MIIHFVTNDKLYSKAHRFVGNERSTHMGLQFTVDTVDMIFDCSTQGAQMCHPKHWFKEYYPVYSVGFPLVNCQRNIIIEELTGIIGARYDWGAYFYLWYCGLLRFAFGCPLPSFNPFSTRKEYICTEILDVIEDTMLEFGYNFSVFDYSIVTPDMLYEKLKNISGVTIDENPQVEKYGG